MKKNIERLNEPETPTSANGAPRLQDRLRRFAGWLFCPYRRVLVKIVPHHAESVYKLEISHLHLALASLSLLAIGVLLLVSHFADIHAAEARVRALQAVEVHQRQELSAFSKQTHSLWQRVDKLQRDDEEIHRLTRIIVPKVKPKATGHDKATAGTPKQYGAARLSAPASVAQGVRHFNTRRAQSEAFSPWHTLVLWLHSLGGNESFGFAAEAAQLSSLTAAVNETDRQTIMLEERIRAEAEATIARELAHERYLAAIPSIWPTLGYVSSGFGYRSYPDYGFHPGLDIVNDYGAPIVATAAGVVVEAGWYYGYGYRVTIDHGNGLRTMYAHASRLLVDVGQTVRKGQQIGDVGESGFATGPHVHYQVELWGRPIDPTPYLSGSVKVVALGS